MGNGKPRIEGTVPLARYLFALALGMMSVVLNIGYALAFPISYAGVAIGLSKFVATNCIWFLMLGAGSFPNIVYCILLMDRNQTAQLPHRPAFWSGAAALAFERIEGLLKPCPSPKLWPTVKAIT